MRPRGWIVASVAGCAWVLLVALSPRLAQSANPAAQAPSPLVLHSVHQAGDQFEGRLKDKTPAKLTLHPKYQAATSRLLRDAFPLAGAALMVDVRSGRVLAMEQFSRPGTPRRDVLTTQVPAASLFKLVTTASLFEHSRVHPKSRVCVSGGERRIERVHLEPPARTEARCARFESALGFSRNAVYAQLATEHLTHRDLLETAERFGFNRALPFDAEASVGRVDLPYGDLEFARAAAGFQGSWLSPVGAAHIAYSIALGGLGGRMRVLADQGPQYPRAGRELLPRLMNASTAWRLSRMMEVTVHSGTSLQAFTAPDGHSYLGEVRVAGKTGTLERSDNTISWFTGFAPSRDPKVVVTVMLENAPVWRRRANEVARDLFRSYFQGAPGVSDPFEEQALALGPAPTKGEQPQARSEY